MSTNVQLKSHTVKVTSTPETSGLQYVGFELASDYREGETTHLQVVNDFSAASMLVENTVTIGTLLEVLHTTLQHPYIVPKNHATAWHAVAKNVANALEAYQFSAALWTIENAKPNSLNVRIVAKVIDTLEPIDPVVSTFDKADVAVDYRELLQRFGRYQHNFHIEDDTLVVDYWIPAATFATANLLATQMSTVVDYATFVYIRTHRNGEYHIVDRFDIPHFYIPEVDKVETIKARILAKLTEDERVSNADDILFEMQTGDGNNTYPQSLTITPPVVYAGVVTGAVAMVLHESVASQNVTS